MALVGDILSSSIHCWAFSGHPGRVPAAFRDRGGCCRGSSSSGGDAPLKGTCSCSDDESQQCCRAWAAQQPQGHTQTMPWLLRARHGTSAGLSGAEGLVRHCSQGRFPHRKKRRGEFLWHSTFSIGHFSYGSHWQRGGFVAQGQSCSPSSGDDQSDAISGALEPPLGLLQVGDSIRAWYRVGRAAKCSWVICHISVPAMLPSTTLGRG